MLAARPRQTAVLLFLRPIPQQFPPQLPDLFEGALLRLIGRTACRHRLIHYVRNRMKPRQNVRAFGHPLLQGDLVTSGVNVFIVHEPLQIYKPPPRIQAYFMGTSKIPSAPLP